MDYLNKVVRYQMLTYVLYTVYNIYYELKVVDMLFLEMFDGGIA